MSRRQELIDAIEARLSLISVGQVFTLPSGDYVCQNDIKGAYPWRKTPFNKAELPAIEFWDPTADTGPGPSGEHEHQLPIVLVISVEGSTCASIARTLMEDVMACIGSDPRWGGARHLDRADRAWPDRGEGRRRGGRSTDSFHRKIPHAAVAAVAEGTA